MRFLFEMGHPADVHLFRHAIAALERDGHAVRVAAVSKERLLNLLQAYGLQYDLIARNTPTLTGKAITLLGKDVRLIYRSSSWRPDMIVSMCSPYAAHASAVLGVPHIAFNDTEIAGITMRVTLPFTDAICTPTCFESSLGRKQIRFDGYKELAYLHPNYFQPDPSILDQIGARPDDKFVVVRFGVIDASHDLRYRGFDLRTDDARVAFVRALEAHARVFVTSESAVGPELRRKAPPIPSVRLHDLLYYASLYIGDGATMAAEAGVLGTPWVYVSTSSRGFLNEQQQRYGLGFRDESAEQAYSHAVDLLQRPGLKTEWQERRMRMLSEKVDVTKFMVSLLEHWPQSVPKSRSVSFKAA